LLQCHLNYTLFWHAHRKSQNFNSFSLSYISAGLYGSLLISVQKVLIKGIVLHNYPQHSLSLKSSWSVNPYGNNLNTVFL
jgi:hypothetical protein